MKRISLLVLDCLNDVRTGDGAGREETGEASALTILPGLHARGIPRA